MKIKNTKEALAASVVAMLVAQVMLFLVSWLVTAASPETNMRSLLSNEGIRWFFGSFTDNVAVQPLVWIIVLAMAWGMVTESQITDTLLKRKQILLLNSNHRLNLT